MSRVDKAKRLRQLFETSVQAVRSMIRIDELSKEELDDLKLLYPKWQEDKSYKVGDIVRYNNEVYKVVQEHTSQANWTPDKTSALFSEIAPEGVIPEWEQPLGAHDAYNKGDKVIFDGEVYISLNDGNIHSPSDFPQGWELVED